MRCIGPVGLVRESSLVKRIDDAIDFNGRALLLRSERQRVIASNIANADTPGFQARELDFAQSLRAASAFASGTTLSTTDARHSALGAAAAGGSTQLVYATPSQASLDRNTVDMDRERAAFADNGVRYEATLRFINSHVRTMLSAITGQ